METVTIVTFGLRPPQGPSTDGDRMQRSHRLIRYTRKHRLLRERHVGRRTMKWLWLVGLFWVGVYAPTAHAQQAGGGWCVPHLPVACTPCWCRNDYCPKPMPCTACVPAKCCDDYCVKPLPLVPCPVAHACCNDYCVKPLPSVCCPTRAAPYFCVPTCCALPPCGAPIERVGATSVAALPSAATISSRRDR